MKKYWVKGRIITIPKKLVEEFKKKKYVDLDTEILSVYIKIIENEHSEDILDDEFVSNELSKFIQEKLSRLTQK